MKSPVYDFFEKIAPESVVTWVGLNTGKTAFIVCWLTFLFFRDIWKNGENCVLALFLGLFGIKWKDKRKSNREVYHDHAAHIDYESNDAD